MLDAFEQKGKIFTQVIPKASVPVTIQTTTHRIHGHIHVRPEGRIKDEMNQAEKFAAVTEAVVFGQMGEELFTTNFLTINTNQIIWIIPDEELSEKKELHE